MSDFYGSPTAILENDHIRLEYLTTAGPRIVRFSYRGSANLFADVHDFYLDGPAGKCFLWGGHRLWVSPEVPERTYIPDSSGLKVQETGGGVELVWENGEIHKKMRIDLDAERPVLRLVHTLTNSGAEPIELAPWVITMFSLGGTVLLPQPVGNADPHGLLHNRTMSLWPYTRISDLRLALRDDFILLRADPGLPPVKLGYANIAGWLAYWWKGILFRKSCDFHIGATYPDGGCNTETYCNDRFVELENLGPVVALAPGEKTSLTETWELFPTLDVPFIPEAIRDLLGKS